MIDLTLPGEALTASLVDVPSPSGSEGRLADEVESALRQVPHLKVERDGDAVVARTEVGSDRRIVEETLRAADELIARADGMRIIDTVTEVL